MDKALIFMLARRDSSYTLPLGDILSSGVHLFEVLTLLLFNGSKALACLRSSFGSVAIA